VVGESARRSWRSLAVAGTVLAVLGASVGSGSSPAGGIDGGAGGWVRQHGSAQNDVFSGIGHDATGQIYVAGTAFGKVPGSDQHFGDSDVVVASYTATGALRWVRQLGNALLNQGFRSAFAADGTSYVVGTTSGGFPGSTDPQPGTSSDRDLLVLSLDGGGTVRWVRVLGTASAEYGYGIALAPSGGVVVSGGTQGAFAPGATPAGGTDAFVARFSDLGALEWSTQLGSTNDDYAWDLAVAADGSVVVAGDTNGAIAGSGASPQGSWDQFVARFAADGTLAWVRQDGSPAVDGGARVAVDARGTAYVVGTTTGTMPGTTATPLGGGDLHVSAFGRDGGRRWIRQFGTSGQDVVEDVEVDAAGTVTVAGQTAGVLPGALEASGGGLDAFVLSLDQVGAQQWVRQIGSSAADYGKAVVADGEGRVLLAGSTFGTLPRSAAASAGGSDAFVADIGQRWPAPFSTVGSLVDRLHRDLVGRVPTSAERGSWTTALQGGTATPVDLVRTLRRSADHAGSVDPVTRLYRAYLLRVPDPGGLGYWIGRRRAGRTLQWISEAFASSSEFARRYGALSNRQFVELIYANVLGRPGEASGVEFWTGRLDRKVQSRGGVMLNFSDSNEYKRKQAGAVEVSAISILLGGRAPLPAVFDDLVALAQVEGVEAMGSALAGRILTSDAYAARVS
jgi:hypothetical protein